MTICFAPSSLTLMPSFLTVKSPIVVCLAGLQEHLLVELESAPRESQEDQHDAEVDDVAAVAPLVAADETDERRQEIGAGRLLADIRAAPEFLQDVDGHECAEREAQARASRRRIPSARETDGRGRLRETVGQQKLNRAG